MKVRFSMIAKSAALILLTAALFAMHLLRTPEVPEPYQYPATAELIATGRHAEAYHQLLLVEVSALTPGERGQLEYQLAICERLLDKHAQASARLQHLEQALPVLEDYRLYWIARSLEHMEHPEAAVAAYLELLTRSQHPELTDRGRLHLMALYGQSGNHDEALLLGQQILAGFTGFEPEVLYRTGSIHGQQADTLAQRHVWLELARRFPGSSWALRAIDELPVREEENELRIRTQVYTDHRRHADAVRLLRTLLRAYPRQQPAHTRYQLGRVLAAQGRYDEALETYRALAADGSMPAAWYRMGALKIRMGRSREATRTFERFVRMYPNHALADQALWQMAKAAERRDDFGTAAVFYRRLVEECPNSDLRDEAEWNIGFMYYLQQEYHKALPVFQHLSRVATKPHIVDQSLFWAGKSAEELGQKDVARQHYHQAAAAFPRSYYSSRVVALGLAPAPALQPRPHAAATTINPTVPARMHGEEYIQRADALAALGRRDLAGRELQWVETRNQGNPSALQAIRDRYAAYGMPDRAMRLSVQVYVGAGSEREIHHIYPQYFWDQVSAAAAEANVDPLLVLSVMRQESAFNPRAESRAGALGLMQVMPQTGRKLGRTLGLQPIERDHLLDPDTSIRLGTHFLGDQIRQFAGHNGDDMQLELGLAAYNAGPHNARRWLERMPDLDIDTFVERIPFLETRRYFKLVLRNYTIYRALSDA